MVAQIGVLAAHNRGSRSPDWLTETRIVECVLIVVRELTLDPCSDAAKSIPARCHYTIEDDGLKQEWFGSVFMNPPYGRVLPLWMRKLSMELAARRVCEAITLTPASTDSGWFAPLWDAQALCFVRGRLRFSGSSVNPQSHNAPHASVVGYFGPHKERFADVFGDVGKVVYP